MSLAHAAEHLAKRGRNGDTALVHMTQDEVAGLAALARAHGGELTVNPDTGLPEANFLKKILPALAGGVVSSFTGLSPLMAGLLVGGATGLATGDTRRGLMAGLGAYGGAGLAGGLAGLGEQALAQQATRGMTPEAFAEGLSPTQLAPPPSAMEKLSAGFGRLTDKDGLEAYAKQMGGAKGLMMAGLPALMGASAFEPQKAVPTVTRQPGMIRYFDITRNRVPEEEARRTGRYFDDRISAREPFAAADGGAVPGFAEGGSWRDMNALLDQYSDSDKVNRAAWEQLAGADLHRMSQEGAIKYLQQRVSPELRPRVHEGDGYSYTDPYAYLTPDFDPEYAGGTFGRYGVDAEGKVNFVKGERSGSWFNDNMDWLGPLLVGGAALAGGAGLLGGAGAAGEAAAAPWVSGYDLAAGGAGAAGEAAAAGAAAAPITEATGAIAGAGANAAAPTLSSGLGSLASGIGSLAAANPLTTAALVSGAAGALGGSGQPAPAAASSGSDIPTSTSPIALSAPSVITSGGPGPNQQTQSEAAYRYLMGEQRQSRPMAQGGLAALAQGGEAGSLGDYSDGGRLLRGPGDGVSDDIPASINGKRPARLADGEFVIPARIVSELGNGSTEAGARQLYAMMDRIQHRRRKSMGKDAVAKDTKARNALPA